MGDDLKSCVPKTLEIAFLLPSAKSDEKPDDENANEAKKMIKNKFYPGIFIASSVARFVRPVKNLEFGGIEWIGPLE